MVVASIAVAVVTAVAVVPPALARWWLTPDVIEYLATGHAWISGSGFFNPLQWYYSLDVAPPIPAPAVRAPILSLLAAMVFAAGGDITTVTVVHTIWASAVAGGSVWVASRFMRWPAAAAAGVALGASPAWLELAPLVLTEVTGVAALLAVIATADRARRSAAAAFVCGLLTLLAWLVRPNLLAVALAVPAAGILTVGLRAGLRSRPLAVYGVTVGMGVGAIQLAFHAVTGLYVYEGYASMGEFLHPEELFRYGKEYVGTLGYVSAHAPRILVRLRLWTAELWDVLFLAPSYFRIGWLAVPAVLIALARPSRDRVEPALCALCGLGFSLVCVLNFAWYGGVRYTIFAFVGALLCSLAVADSGLARLAPARWRRAFSMAPLAVVLVLGATTASRSWPRAWASLESYRTYGTREFYGARDQRIIDRCSDFGANERVASDEPWSVVFRCGNAAMQIPLDLDDPELRRAYLTERAPSVFVVSANDARHRWLERIPRFERLGETRGLVVYRDTEVARRSVWTAPIPLACVGKPASCRERVGR